MDPRYRSPVDVLAYGGLRIGEAAGLRPKDVDLDRGRLHIVQAIAEVEGKIHVQDPKTRQRRTVTLDADTVKALRSHLDEHASREYVFPSPEGGPLRPRNWRARFWNPAVKEAGLEPLHPHELRHTHISLLIDSGAPVRTVSDRAGHSTATQTVDRYAHAFEGQRPGQLPSCKQDADALKAPRADSP